MEQQRVGEGCAIKVAGRLFKNHFAPRNEECRKTKLIISTCFSSDEFRLSPRRNPVLPTLAIRRAKDRLVGRQDRLAQGRLLPLQRERRLRGRGFNPAPLQGGQRRGRSPRTHLARRQAGPDCGRGDAYWEKGSRLLRCWAEPSTRSSGRPSEAVGPRVATGNAVGADEGSFSRQPVTRLNGDELRRVMTDAQGPGDRL